MVLNFGFMCDKKIVIMKLVKNYGALAYFNAVESNGHASIQEQFVLHILKKYFVLRTFFDVGMYLSFYKHSVTFIKMLLI